jgi:hypothetical protein
MKALILILLFAALSFLEDWLAYKFFRKPLYEQVIKSNEVLTVVLRKFLERE